MNNIKLSKNSDSVLIIDQTLLPNEMRWIELQTPQEMFEAISRLRVRGAPAIGIFAAYGLFVLSQKITASDSDHFFSELERLSGYLNSSRPTAVNLSWALSRMMRSSMHNKNKDVHDIIDALHAEADAIYNEDVNMCRAISQYGLSLLKDGDGILTHCNAGPLATSEYGTALGPILLGKEQGLSFRVFADETRPLLQGARLTAYELYNAGVDVTLICDNMASMVMKNGWINACLVGCDRVAANGDTANKIGTSGVAIMAKHYGIPFYVLGPRSTIDLGCRTGRDIKIELRDPSEIKTKFFTSPIAPMNVKCYNPAFDVTDSSLITAIITDKGICYPPYEKSLSEIMER